LRQQGRRAWTSGLAGILKMQPSYPLYFQKEIDLADAARPMALIQVLVQ
jgi:hypothetical protein